ncbi:MAG: hypothetical protein LBG96_15335 [Tannerella sp.]|nr:hypothetical protein [Tannerella sp.]
MNWLIMRITYLIINNIRNAINPFETLSGRYQDAIRTLSRRYQDAIRTLSGRYKE